MHGLRPANVRGQLADMMGFRRAIDIGRMYGSNFSDKNDALFTI